MRSVKHSIPVHRHKPIAFRTPSISRLNTHKATPDRRQLRAAAAHGLPGEQAKPAGKCWLVGAGPGPADYLTVKAVRLLEAADVVIYDDLGSQDALAHVRPSAQLVYVGKRGGRESVKQPEIDRLLVEHCSRGHQVVRLKGGCPSVFSRVSSEVAALRAAGVEFELVPGISSALAAPLLAGFPLTHVTLSPSFTVLSGHDLAAADPSWWAALRHHPGTLVVLMAGSQLGRLAAGLVEWAGWDPDMPVAVVRSAGLPDQQVWYSSLRSVESDTAGAGSLSPCVVVVGRIAVPAVDGA